jgi:glycosyltransferase involved in cell wall biosynthesis
MKKLLVGLPVYNESRLLKRAVNSILEQTYKNFNLVIVNDGSTDSSLEEAKKFLYDPRVSIINNLKNGGCFYSKNTSIQGMESENYDVYTTHDADDFSQPTRFEKIMNIFEDPTVVGVQDFEMRIGNPPPDWYDKRWTPVCNFAHGFFSSQAFKALGYFDNYQFNADEEYWIRLHVYAKVNGYSINTLQDVLYYAEITDDNMILKYGEDKREVYKKKFLKEIKNMETNNNFYRPFFKYENINWNNV